ncbi:MAG: CinA family protein [Actinomycetaceae bacterium]|nr:CinA family protein [Actinomycetaceae bacterium]
MIHDDDYTKNLSLVKRLTDNSLTISCAESLTGGLLCASFVEVPGASLCVRGGVVTYTNEMKINILGVPREYIDRTGPVDRNVAIAMARKAREMFHSDYALATTGVAGPGSADGYEAGTVWIGFASDDDVTAYLFKTDGEREDIIKKTVERAHEILDTYMRIHGI